MPIVIELILAMTVYFPVWHSHCTRAKFTFLVSCSDELLTVHSCPLICLQRQIAKLGKELFYYWTLLRNNNMSTTILQRLTSSCGSRCFAAAGLPIWHIWSQILKFWLFLNTFDLFGNKKQKKSGFFQSERLVSGKHCLSCIFITNLFWKESITMQGAQNIEKILLLPKKWSMLLIKNKCTTV